MFGGFSHSNEPLPWFVTGLLVMCVIEFCLMFSNWCSIIASCKNREPRGFMLLELYWAYWPGSRHVTSRYRRRHDESVAEAEGSVSPDVAYEAEVILCLYCLIPHRDWVDGGNNEGYTAKVSPGGDVALLNGRILVRRRAYAKCSMKKSKRTSRRASTTAACLAVSLSVLALGIVMYLVFSHSDEDGFTDDVDRYESYPTTEGTHTHNSSISIFE